MSQEGLARRGFTALGNIRFPTTSMDQLIQTAITVPRATISICFDFATKVIERPVSFDLLLAAGYEEFRIERAHRLIPMLVNTAAGLATKSELNSKNYHLVQDGSLVQFRLQFGHGAFTVNPGDRVLTTSADASGEGEVLLQTSEFNILKLGDRVWVSESGQPGKAADDTGMDTSIVMNQDDRSSEMDLGEDIKVTVASGGRK